MKYNLLIILEIIFSLPASLLLTKLVIKLSNKINFVSTPNPLVDSHNTATPYGGGVTIGIVIIGILLINPISFQLAGRFIIILLPVIVAGILDDIFDFSPFVKIIIEIMSVLPFIFFFTNVPIYLLLFLILFILLSQNAWNLIDVMDGLTAGVSVIVFLSLGIILLIHQFLEFYSFLSLVIAFSVLGFRFWNKYPARIFLGETGSILLGSLFAFIVIIVFLFNKEVSGFLLLLGVVPFFELSFLVIVRTQKRIPFYKGSPDHFALRMFNNGFDINKINRGVLLYCAIHSLIIISFSFWGNTMINLLICFALSLISVIIAYWYFQSLPSKRLIK